MAQNINEAALQNLRDAGCDEELIQRFQKCCEEGKEREGMRLLAKHRDELLEAMHREQKHIDCLDYFLYQRSQIPRSKLRGNKVQ